MGQTREGKEEGGREKGEVTEVMERGENQADLEYKIQAIEN
jgi:hypothetical protein